MLAAANACGFDQDLAASEPLRIKLRFEIEQNSASSEEGRQVREQMCTFFKDHRQPDAGRDLSQYISLGLFVGEPPDMTLRGKESDVPPDAAYVLGLIPHLQRFYRTAGLQRIWDNHRADYEVLLRRYQPAISELLFKTDVYLKLASSGYVGRGFTVFLEPMGPPGQINSRNYGVDYYLVLSPGRAGMKLEQLRHTYLHFVIDPLILKRANALKRLQPLLEEVQTAPMEDSFKADITLLVEESLIRAVESRMEGSGKTAEPARERTADAAMAEGFVLTRHFFEQLKNFESDPAGIRDAVADWLYSVDLAREKRRASDVVFATKASPEGLRESRSNQALWAQAEDRLASGDAETARSLAQLSLDRKEEQPERALFVLARTSKDMRAAKVYFERTVEVARDPRILAWAHVYLGRIYDGGEERDKALEHYRAAMIAGNAANDAQARAAAQRGIEKPYEPVRPK